jgi:hypothetical protein
LKNELTARRRKRYCLAQSTVDRKGPFDFECSHLVTYAAKIILDLGWKGKKLLDLLSDGFVLPQRRLSLASCCFSLLLTERPFFTNGGFISSFLVG